jgi:hypothetical protein
MSKRFYGTAIAVLVIGLVPTAAYAHSASNSSTGASASCVDFNNNGVCDTGDVPLLPLLQSGNGVVNTASVARPSTAPSDGPVGVVINGLRPPAGYASIVTSGNVHVNGGLRTGADGFAFLRTTGGDIDVAPGASIKTGDIGAQLTAGPRGNVNIGAGANISSRGGDSPSTLLISGNNVTIGDNAKIVAQGYNATLSVNAAAVLTVGNGVTLATSGPDEGPGPVNITAHSNVTLDGATLAGRGVHVSALASTGGSPARHIKISNSKITIPHGDGSVRLQADPGTDGQGSNSITNTRINPAGVTVDATPALS